MKNKFICVIVTLLMFGFCFAEKNTYLQDSYDFEAVNKTNSALRFMQKLNKLEPKNSFYNLRTAWLYYSISDYSNAMKFYDKSYSIDKNLEALEGKLNCAYALKSWDNVIAICTNILKVYPKNFNALTYKAYAFYVKKQFDLAANFYRKATTIYPYNVSALGYLLSSELKSGNKQAAAITYKKLKKIYPASLAIAEYEK